MLLFLLLVTLNNYFLLGQEGQGEGLCEGGTWVGAKFRVFFFFFLLLRGRGVENNVFFSPDI